MNRIICILCAGVKKDQSGRWVSTGWDDKEDFRPNVAPGGQLRAWAAYYLLQDHPELNIFVPGGRGHDVWDDDSKRPDLSDIVKADLKTLGIAPGRILTEHASSNTKEQLVALVHFMKAEAVKQAIIISDKYHLERVKAMIDNVSGLRELKNSKVELHALDNVLGQHDRKRWQPVLNNFYGRPETRGYIVSEQKGAKDIKAGKYEF